MWGGERVSWVHQVTHLPHTQHQKRAVMSPSLSGGVPFSSKDTVTAAGLPTYPVQKPWDLDYQIGVVPMNCLQTTSTAGRLTISNWTCMKTYSILQIQYSCCQIKIYLSIYLSISILAWCYQPSITQLEFSLMKMQPSSAASINSVMVPNARLQFSFLEVRNQCHSLYQ